MALLSYQWRRTWEQMGVALSPPLLAAFDDIVARYSEAHRRYHTLQHLEECFASLAEIRHLAGHPAEVEVALWFHDAIYEKRSPQNEARSAQLARSQVIEAGGTVESAARISSLIMATRHVAPPRGKDAKVLVDADLSILGARPERFDEFERQVREEYSWVPAFVFRKQRKRILMEFLARPAVFNTDVFRQRHEQQARENLRRSIERLGG